MKRLGCLLGLLDRLGLGSLEELLEGPLGRSTWIDAFGGTSWEGCCSTSVAGAVVGPGDGSVERDSIVSSPALNQCALSRP